MPGKASKLLARMRQSKANWKPEDLERLYKGYGFVVESASKHDKVWHPEFPQLVTFLPRHKNLAKAYVTTAVKMIDRLIELRSEQERREHEQD